MEFYNVIVRFLCHSTAFLYRTISATVKMLKIIHITPIFTTYVTQNHGDGRRSRHTTGITVKITKIVNTWLSHSANKCYSKCACLHPFPLTSTHLIHCISHTYILHFHRLALRGVLSKRCGVNPLKVKVLYSR